MKNKNTRSGIYLLCVVLLLILVIAAFILPQSVLLFQDKQIMNDIRLAERSGLDYSAVDMEYVMDMKERISKFARGIAEGKQYFITSSEATDSLNDAELIDMIMMQEWFWIIWDMGQIELDKEINIQVLSKEYFVIYNNDTNDGASFVCWYFQLHKENEYDLNILIDAKDYTLYYAEVYNQNTRNTKSHYEYYLDMGTWEYLPEYFLYYYESDEFFRKAESDADAGNTSIILNGYEDMITRDFQRGEFSQSFSYESSSLTFSVYLTDEKHMGFSGVCFGIQELIDLLPEDKKAVKLQLVN